MFLELFFFTFSSLLFNFIPFIYPSHHLLYCFYSFSVFIHFFPLFFISPISDFYQFFHHLLTWIFRAPNLSLLAQLSSQAFSNVYSCNARTFVVYIATRIIQPLLLQFLHLAAVLTTTQMPPRPTSVVFPIAHRSLAHCTIKYLSSEVPTKSSLACQNS